MKKGLGKGFGSLLPENFDNSVMLDKQERVQKLLIQDIKPDPKQPRRMFDQTAINELAESIKRYGILQPLVVTLVNDEHIIVAGERRWRAAQKAGLTHVPTLVRTIEELERLEIGLIENVQRVDLTPMEQALSIARLHDQFSMSHQEIAKRLGKAHTTVVNTARLLQLPDFAQKILTEGGMSEGHARAVLALKDDINLQKRLVELIIKDGLSVRQAEAFVKTTKDEQPKPKLTSAATKKASPVAASLQQKYGGEVKVQDKKQGGTVQFNFKTNKDFTQFLQKLTD